jgi:hypothetical protein
MRAAAQPAVTRWSSSPSACARLARPRQQRCQHVCSAQPECLVQMASQYNPAISVWSIPDDPQFPPEMRNAVILTLDDSGQGLPLLAAGRQAQQPPQAYEQLAKDTHGQRVPCCACRQCSQPLQAQWGSPDRCLLVCSCFSNQI